MAQSDSFVEKSKMTTTPTKDTLLALLKRKRLNDLVNDLEQDITTFEEMMARTKAQWERRWGENGIDIYNHLHPSSQQSSRSGSQKKQKTGWATTSIAPLKYDSSSVVFELDSAYLADSGLPVSQKLVLYCRPSFHQQFKFLQEKVIDNARLGWIIGPPGTGKSTTALAFASTLDSNEWVVTWIHLSRILHPICVRYERGEKKTRSIRDRSLDELDDVLDEVEVGRKHIIFIDGYALNGDKHVDIQKTCYAWVKQNKVNRRLVVVCSMSSRGKTKPEEDMMNNVEEFFVYSWELDEYLAAVEHDSFFNNIKHSLDSSNAITLRKRTRSKHELPRQELIKSKFYFAGGCCRFMFLFNTATVIDYLEDSVDVVNDIIPYIRGAFIDIEMWFFALLRRAGVKLCDKHGNTTEEWPLSIVHPYSEIPVLPQEGGVWLKPLKWNQGGYDAVFLDQSRGIVRFVQVTRSDSHSFKIGYFQQFLVDLRDSQSSFAITNLEIVFLVLKEKLSGFTISQVSGKGLLADFGWEKGKEVDKVKVAGIAGWD